MKESKYKRYDELTGEMFKAVFHLPNDVFRLGLKSGDLLVYIYLQYQKGAHSDQCWPSYATIGAAVGMSRKTVQKHIGALIDKGLIRAECVPYSAICKKQGNIRPVRVCTTMCSPLGSVSEMSPSGRTTWARSPK